MNTFNCPQHGVQPAITTVWFRPVDEPILGASILANLQPFDIEECSVCEAEMNEDLGGVLERLSRGELQFKPATGPRWSPDDA